MRKTNKNTVSQFNLHEKIFTKQVRILHKNLLVSIPANFICAAVVFISLQQVEKSTLIWSWFIAVIFTSLFRLAALYFYYQRPQKELLHYYIFIIGMSLSAILWGIAGSMLMPKNDLLQQMVIIVVIAGVTAGGLQTLNVNLMASLIYVCLIVFPLSMWLLLQNGLSYLVMGIAMTTYLLFMLVTSVRGNKLLEKTLTLDEENLILIENLSASNQKLLQSYQTLEQHEHEIELINKMNDKLQTCQNLTEAYTIILLTAKNLFASISGGLVILNPSTNSLETLGQWGEDQTLKSSFTINDCWALREGHSYSVNDPTKDLLCYHFNSTPSAYICLPLMIQGNVIGLLVLHAPTQDAVNGYHSQLATSFCEVIHISLTNIKLRETLYEQAIHDPLTGLFNRRYLDETLTRELQRIIREKKTLCVAMLDLDYFKNFNDTNGHEAGDEVLKFIGILLNENFRESDIACRFGGEEFLVILINSDLSTAYPRLQHIREAVKRGNLQFNGHRLPTITISIGIAEAPLQGSTAKDIIEAADKALYIAKQTGRNKVVMADTQCAM